jgi:XTP/dITP diphosphohydrolase
VREILVATSNAGKLRDLNAMAANRGIRIAGIPDFKKLPPAREDAPTFEANACEKAEYYSRYVPGRYVLADDSGLAVDALDGAPGVHSARYALLGTSAEGNATDAANNACLLSALENVPDAQRGARFVCILAVARNGRTVICFRGEVAGTILHAARGSDGFGYDPLFYVAACQRTFGELTPAQKGELSHRGIAFRKFLAWFGALSAAEMANRSPDNTV